MIQSSKILINRVQVINMRQSILKSVTIQHNFPIFKSFSLRSKAVSVMLARVS